MTSDAELLTAWRARDDAAGTALVRRHFEMLSRFFRNRAPAHRVDLMQKTWLGCLESRDRVPDHVPFRAYLLGIARRVLIHHFREHARDAVGDEIPEAIDAAASPSRAMALLAEERLLLQALRRLPLDMQLTLELFYWEELGVAEVAAVLEVPAGTVKSRMSRAKQMLRDELDRLDPPADLLASTQADLERWARSIRRFLGRDRGE